MKKLFLIALLTGVLAGKTAAQDAEMTKKNIRSMYKALEMKTYAQFADLLSENPTDYAGPQPIQGKEAVVKQIQGIFDGLSDVKIAIEDIAVSGNKYYVKNTLTAKHTGNLFGMIPPTNKSVVWSDVDILEFDKEGKCRAHWANNPNGLFEQIGYLAFTNPNTMYVMQGYEKFGKGDVAGIVDLSTDDVVWDVTDNPSPTVARVYKGKKELGMFFKTLGAGLQISKFEPIRFLADGDNVTAYVMTEYKLAGSNKLYKTTLVHHFTFRDGKIASFKEIIDLPQEVTMAAK
ncbi:MAG: nuclear transport factor 2 family protein [Spirosomataceae bacterium]